MPRIERLLCPLDLSEFSTRAYDYAQSLAQRYKARLLVMHVPHPPFLGYPDFAYTEVVHGVFRDLRGHAEVALQKFLETRTRSSVNPEIQRREGTIPESILTVAQEQQVDLIVMGTHGHQGLDRLLLGSVTEKVLRKARCPVLAVRKPVHEFVTAGDGEDPVKLAKILLCTDFSEPANRALEYALSLALEYAAELTLVHVLEQVPPSTELSSATEEVTRRLEQLVPAEPRTWCTVKSRTRLGRPHQEIIQLALEDHIDLIVLGVMGRNTLDLAVFGSTTHRVIQQGPCPVLAVHM